MLLIFEMIGFYISCIYALIIITYFFQFELVYRVTLQLEAMRMRGHLISPTPILLNFLPGIHV